MRLSEAQTPDPIHVSPIPDTCLPKLPSRLRFPPICMAKTPAQKKSNGSDSSLNFEAQLWTAADKMRAQVDALPPPLLARAFAGLLVPQDPTNEPAAKLLERIKRNGEPHGAR